VDIKVRQYNFQPVGKGFSFDFEGAGSLAYFLFENGSYSQNIIHCFVPLTPEKNEKLISRFFEKMVLPDEMDMEKASSLKERMYKYQRKLQSR